MGTHTQSKCSCCKSSGAAGIIFGVIAFVGLAALGMWALKQVASSSQEDPESKTDRLLDEIELRLKQLSEYQQGK